MSEEDEEGESETIEFSSHGIRMVVLDEKGGVSHFDNWALNMLGGVLPVVGDYFATLWPEDDPDPNDVYVVVDRYYVGEFKGDNCWWLVLRKAPTTKQHMGVFRIAREQSVFRRQLKEEHNRQVLEHLERLASAGKDKKRGIARRNKIASRRQPPLAR